MGENRGVGRTAILGLPASMTLHGVFLNATPGSVGRMATGYGSCVGLLSCTDGVVVGGGVSTGLDWGTMGGVRVAEDDDASAWSSMNCSRNSGGNVKGVVCRSLWSSGGGEMSS